MTVSVSERKSGLGEAAGASNNAVRLTVTGVDARGRMFRHLATVLMLDGRDCVLLSESQPEQNGSILLEFDFSQADPRRSVSQGRVKSNNADLEKGLYKIVVELEIAQTAKVFPEQVESRNAARKPALQAVPAGMANSAENNGDPLIDLGEFPSLSKPASPPQPPPRANRDDAPTFQVQSPEPVLKAEAESPIALRESVKSAVASEIKQEISVLKAWISAEMEKVLPTLVSSKLETVINDAVEQQVSAKYKSSMQALHADVAHQVGHRIAESKEIYTALESMARKLFEEQTEVSRAAAARIGQDLNTRSTAMIESFENSIADMEVRINLLRTEMENVLIKAHALQQETNGCMLSVQSAVEHMQNSEIAGMEKIQGRIDAQLNTRAAQFDELLSKISTDRAVQFSTGMEENLIPHQQRANETVEKFGAMLQLLQGTARMQQEQLTEHSRTTAANFEKEIRALLLRLANGG